MGKLTWTHQRLTEEGRVRCGIYNGARVKLARESRGLARATLARKLGMPAAELGRREGGWWQWDERLRAGLVFLLDYPPAFFAQEDAPDLFADGGPIFMCGHDANGRRVCEVIMEPQAKRCPRG